MSKLSYRTMLRSSSIIGGASVVNILANLLKLKIAAVLLGPAGVGLVGLYQSLMQTAGSVAGLGLANSGTRQIAAASADGGAAEVGRVRRALFWGTLAQAILGAMLFWLVSGWIAACFVAAPERANHVAWLSLGVGLSVAAGAQSALLIGLRQTGDIARVQVGSGTGGAALGVAALWLWGDGGLIAMVLAAPVVTFLLGHVYVSRLKRPSGPPDPPPLLAREWGAMAQLGFAFMMSNLITIGGFLAVRVLVQRELGAEALGQFQAAWAIGMTYLGFVLGAMGADYYPRLTAAIGDRAAAVRLVNEQTEVALLLCGPVIVAMLGCAPWVIRLLYTAEFGPAVEILRWQLLGDILKVMSWPLGFILFALGAGKAFVLTETLGMAVFILGVLTLLPLIGVTATGVAFLALYVVYLPLVWWLGRCRIGFRWTRAVWVQAIAVIGAAVAVDAAARWSEPLGAVLGIVLAAGMGFWTVIRLSEKTGAGGRLGRIAALSERVRNG
ncbi:O-antigen translocase [Rhodomicrobium udaipurense]|uniref:O-antigen translocase n=1 Tax=Rhodomicrobium udaipurense TaxID=1202716 RepID=A0A8I1GIU3_9HYPH|nr:O-antigen translocase [Rhodomicrobium udaipurense]MBJ7545191.1 O-antigen translocase [Rhodomicrobium udaipurense]